MTANFDLGIGATTKNQIALRIAADKVARTIP